MKVKLRRTWFTPIGTRARKGIHEDLPIEWAEKLPSDAVIMDMDDAAPAIPLIVKDLPEENPALAYDLERTAGDAEQRVRELAEIDSPYATADEEVEAATDEGEDNDDDV